MDIIRTVIYFLCSILTIGVHFCAERATATTMRTAYCSSYCDEQDNWISAWTCYNTSTVYCCGTARNKFCCQDITKQILIADKYDCSDEDDSGSGWSLIISIAFAVVIVLVFLIACTCACHRRYGCKKTIYSENGRIVSNSGPATTSAADGTELSTASSRPHFDPEGFYAFTPPPYDTLPAFYVCTPPPYEETLRKVDPPVYDELYTISDGRDDVVFPIALEYFDQTPSVAIVDSPSPTDSFTINGSNDDSAPTTAAELNLIPAELNRLAAETDSHEEDEADTPGVDRSKDSGPESRNAPSTLGV